MGQEEIKDQGAENLSTNAKLTKRNQQYIFDLKKALIAANMSEEEINNELASITQALVQGQKTGMTARQLYGTVTECTTAILERPEPVKEATWWQLWLDNALMMFALLAVMMGIMKFISKDAQSIGILALVISAAVGGVVLYLMYELVYKYDRPGADKSKRPSLWKSIIILIFAFLVWLICFGAVNLLPASVNPVLDPLVLIVLGAAAFGGRYLLKKKYNYQGTMFSR